MMMTSSSAIIGNQIKKALIKPHKKGNDLGNEEEGDEDDRIVCLFRFSGLTHPLV